MVMISDYFQPYQTYIRHGQAKLAEFHDLSRTTDFESVGENKCQQVYNLVYWQSGTHQATTDNEVHFLGNIQPEINGSTTYLINQLQIYCGWSTPSTCVRQKFMCLLSVFVGHLAVATENWFQSHPSNFHSHYYFIRTEITLKKKVEKQSKTKWRVAMQKHENLPGDNNGRVIPPLEMLEKSTNTISDPLDL